MDFSIIKRGYSPEEVDNYITHLKQDYENELTRQNERVRELKQINLELVDEIKAYRKKEQSIGRAIEASAEKAEEVDKAILARYALAVQRLRQFESKWLNYYAELSLKGDVDKETKEFANIMKGVEQDIIKVMKEDLHMTSSRVASDDKPIPQPKIEDEDYKPFDLEEAITPKDSLETICKDLGLI